MSLVVIFPVEKDAEAAAYLDWCNLNCPDPPWANPALRDAYGQRVVGYLGPGGYIWNGEPFPEPEGGEAARADGVLQEGFDPYVDPEE